MKRIIVTLTVLCMMLTVSSATLVVHAESKPTLEDGYYIIDTAEKLAWFATEVNNGNGEINAKLTANIDLSSVCHPGSDDVEKMDWTPIGNNTNRFTGIFDGQGHTISNLYINNSSQHMGLFGVVAGGTDGKVTIKNVGVSGSVTAGNYAAGLVAMGETATLLLIENCHTDVTVNAGKNSAGIFGVSNVGRATVTIKSCLNTGDITGANESAAISGWLGTNALVQNTYNTGSVSGIQSGKPFARMSSATFINCKMSATVGSQDNVGVLEDSVLTSGELAFSLGEYWGQNIDGAGTLDATPVIGGARVYAIYGESCLATGYTNTQPSVARPDHTDVYYDGENCEVCGEAVGLDLTAVTEDIVKAEYTWSYAERTLTLNGLSVTTAASVGINLPANSKIVLAEGSENTLTVTDPVAIGIFCTGSLSIEGKGSLTVNTAGGNIIRCNAPEEDAVLSVKNTAVYGSGGQINMPKTNQSSQFIVENAIFNIGDACNVYVGGKDDTELNATSAIIIKNSTTVTGKLGMEANTLNGTGIFSITDNSNVKATQSNGNAVDSGVNITAYDFDIDIHDSHLTAWTKGHNWGGNSYAFRVNGKHDMTLNMSRSNMTLYGYSHGLWVDSLNEVSQDSAIENCTIINYSKGNEGKIVIMQKDTAGSSGYGDEDVTSRVVKDNVMLTCSNMLNNASVTMQITGNPVIYRDFTLPTVIGGSNNIAELFTGVVLEENHSLTIMEGAMVTFPESAPIILNKGCTLTGDFEGTIGTVEGIYAICFDYITSKSIFTYESMGIVSEPTEIPSIPGYTLDGYYDDEEFTQKHDFTAQLPDGGVTVYTKWVNNVTYAANDGTDKSNTIEHIYGTNVIAFGAPYFREGYQFMGWNTAANGSGTAVSVGELITFDGTSVTLYAQWKATEEIYTITALPSVTYNGSEYKPELTVSYISGGNAKADVTIISYANNINAGTATVTYTLGNDPTHYTASFTIKKATYDMSGITFVDKTVRYNGKAHTITINGTLPTGADGIQLTVSYNNATATNVADGKVTVVATFATTSPNYEVPEPKTAYVRVTKKTVTVVADAVTVTYGDAEEDLTYTVNGLIGNDALRGALTREAGNNAGTYKIKQGTLTVGGNYTISFVEADYVIEKATYDMSGITFDDKTVEYNGEAHTITINGTLPTGADGIQLTVSYNNATATNVADGRVLVVATFATTSPNHEAPAPMTAYVNVTKKLVTVEANAVTVTYGDAEADLTYTVSGLIGNDTLSGALTREVGSNAGMYKIKQGTLTANDNYTLSFTEADYVIEKATYDMRGITFDDKTVEYNGEAQMPAISGTLPEGVSVSYSASYTEPGSYTVIATFSGDYANYNEIEPMSATFVIETAQNNSTLVIFAIVLAVLTLALAAVFCIRLVKRK